MTEEILKIQNFSVGFKELITTPRVQKLADIALSRINFEIKKI